jgi:polysaccharide biosynthesis/export protein
MSTLLRRTVLLSVALLAFRTGAAQKPQQPVGEPGSDVPVVRKSGEPALQSPNPRYVLRTGDSFDIVFRFTPEFNQTVSIQPDGFISVRELPDIVAAGKTIPELTALLQKHYSKILREPVITVVLKEYEKPYFIAQGEVSRPGKYEMRGDTTVLEGIGIAGGFNESSKHSQVLIFRRVSDQWMSVKKLDVKKMLDTANLDEDLHLRPGDMIYVPKNAMSKVKQYIPIPHMGIYPF